MAYPYSPNQVLLMDGTASIKDLIIGPGTAYTMTGTAKTGTLLGATAPSIGAGSDYATCTMATPFAAGSALSVLIVVNTSWAGNDGVGHFLWDNRASNVGLYVAKWSDSVLYFSSQVNASTEKQRKITVNATNWAAGTHVIIATADASNTQQLFLDGVASTTTTGTSAREGSVGTSYFGSYAGGALYPVAGLALFAMWTRVLTAAEITALSSLTAWSTLTTPVSDGRRRYRKAILGG